MLSHLRNRKIVSVLVLANFLMVAVNSALAINLGDCLSGEQPEAKKVCKFKDQCLPLGCIDSVRVSDACDPIAGTDWVQTKLDDPMKILDVGHCDDGVEGDACTPCTKLACARGTMHGPIVIADCHNSCNKDGYLTKLHFLTSFHADVAD